MSVDSGVRRLAVGMPNFEFESTRGSRSGWPGRLEGRLK